MPTYEIVYPTAHRGGRFVNTYFIAKKGTRIKENGEDFIIPQEVLYKVYRDRDTLHNISCFFIIEGLFDFHFGIMNISLQSPIKYTQRLVQRTLVQRIRLD